MIPFWCYYFDFPVYVQLSYRITPLKGAAPLSRTLKFTKFFKEEKRRERAHAPFSVALFLMIEI